MLSRLFTRQSLTRRFCKPVSFTESEFDANALRELQRIADVIDQQADFIGAEAVDYQEGVLVIEFTKGTFVLNKHTASKQIWYSSPVSPPGYFEPLTDAGKRWWSLRLRVCLRDKLSEDIQTLTGRSLDLNF